MALLDTLIQVHAERLREASTNDKIAAEMAKLPVPTLLKVASGEVKLGFGCLDGEDFLKEFAGSPLQQQALQLEEQGIQLEMEQMQRRAAERKAEQAFDYYEQRDALRLQKKMLILQLRKEQAATGAAPPPVTPSTPSTGTDEAYQEAMKSAADKILEQRAYAEHLQALALQKTAKSDKEYNTSDKVRMGRNVGAVVGALPGVMHGDLVNATARGLRLGVGGAGVGGLVGLLHEGPSTKIDEEIRRGRNVGTGIGAVLGGGEGFLRGGGLTAPTSQRALVEALKGGASGALRGAVYGAGARGLLHLDEETPAVKKAFEAPPGSTPAQQEAYQRNLPGTGALLGTDEAYPEAMKSAADKILEQRAYAEHLQALALQKTAKSDKEYNTSDKVRMGRNVGAVVGALPGVMHGDLVNATARGLRLGVGGAGVGGLVGLLHEGPSTKIDEEIRRGRNVGTGIGAVLGGGEGFLRGGGLTAPTSQRALVEALKGGASGALRGAVYGAGARGLLHLDEETPAVKKAFDPSAAFASAKGVMAKAIPAAREWASKALPAAKDVAINTVKANPAAAAGAVVGGGLGMASELGKKPEDRSFLRAAGKGVVGAGVGAGIGHFGQKSLTKTPGAAVAPVAPPPPVPAT